MGGRWRTWANTFSGSGWVVGYMSLPVLAYTVQDMRKMEVVSGPCTTSLYCTADAAWSGSPPPPSPPRFPSQTLPQALMLDQL